MKTVRVFYEKSGRAIYLSHLDLMRAMQRLLKRSGLPIWYTQGFNPHVYLTFALPLSMGYAGLHESMDFRVLDDALPNEAILEAMQKASPQGIRMLSAGEPAMDPTGIAFADYRLSITFECEKAEAVLEKWKAFDAQEAILAQKKSKKGMIEVDLKELFTLLDAHTEGDALVLALRTRAGTATNLNPTLVIERFCEEQGLTVFQKKIVRTAILAENMEHFS